MEEPTKSFWWKFWGRPSRFFAWATFLSLLGWIGFAMNVLKDEASPSWNDFNALAITLPVFALFILVLIGLIFSAVPRTRPSMSWVLRRWFFCTAALVTVIALFYAEENWRGQRAIERSRLELKAKGVVLDWDKFIPPAVPDDQNVFKAPKMQDWFVNSDGKRDSRKAKELTDLLQSPKNFPVWGDSKTIDTETDARAYLAWSDGLRPQFDLIREALKRPYSRMDGDYSQTLVLPFPNFIAIREVARVLAQRSHCYLIVHEPEKAVAELALMHNLSHLLDAKPTGKPMTLVAAMINVAVVGLHADVIGKGFQTHAWQEAQLVELQRQLSDVHAMIPVATSFESEPAASSRAMRTVSMKDIVNAFGSQANLFRVAPRGWILQNIANETQFFWAPAEVFNIQSGSVSLRLIKDNQRRLEEFISHKSPFRILAAMTIPNFSKTVLTTAHNQNTANEALLACALERYRLANGSYPDSLESLAPKFLDKIPQDVINGGPLQYHRADGSYILYSIGWNEKDDGGTAASTSDNRPDLDNGDWVWQYAAK